jgi:hypothetical protein
MAIYQTQYQTEALLKFRTRYKWVLLMALLALNAAIALFVVLRPRLPADLWERLAFKRWPPVALIAAGAVLLVLPVPLLWYARADFFGRGMEAFFRLLWLYWWLVLVQAAGVRLVFSLDWARALAVALMVDGVAAQIYTSSLAVSSFPFSMGWSEASRYYYGSLVFASGLYGESLPLSVMHGSRYLLQSIAFLIPHLPLWGARLWQVALWLVLTGGASWALVRRLRLTNRTDALIMGAWLFLFFFQGAVYYHLQVCVLLVLLGVTRGHPWRSMVAVVAASFWAGMSRLNWIPVPAMLAAALHVLETPFGGGRSLWEYARRPILWGAAGVAAALGGQAFYIAVSGVSDLEAFGSSLSSPLLWYRWLPSPTNAIGIIPGVLIVSLPIWLLIFLSIRARPRDIHMLRTLGLGALLAILLIGGLVVSTKIGGGGDLHNMDAYLVLLAIIGAYLVAGVVEREPSSEFESFKAPWPAIAWMLLVPVAFGILRLGSPFSYDRERAAADVAEVAREVRTYGRSGEILFMYERHLLTFGLVPKVRMVPEYEVVTLMEMAISANETYLRQYYDDLETHRFAAIVAHPQNLGVESGDFIEENDAWSELVAQPLLCQYKPALTLQYSKVQILVPRARPCESFPPAVGKSWPGIDDAGDRASANTDHDKAFPPRRRSIARGAA